MILKKVVRTGNKCSICARYFSKIMMSLNNPNHCRFCDPKY